MSACPSQGSSTPPPRPTATYAEIQDGFLEHRQQRRARLKRMACFVCGDTWDTFNTAPFLRCDRCREENRSIERVGFCATCGTDFLYDFRGVRLRRCHTCTATRERIRQEQEELDQRRLQERRVAPHVPAWLDLPDFRDAALCGQVDPDLFFPEHGGNTKAARELCGSCPCAVECLTWALKHETPGIWGGTSELERKRMLAARADQEQEDVA